MRFTSTKQGSHYLLYPANHMTRYVPRLSNAFLSTAGRGRQRNKLPISLLFVAISPTRKSQQQRPRRRRQKQQQQRRQWQLPHVMTTPLLHQNIRLHYEFSFAQYPTFPTCFPADSFLRSSQGGPRKPTLSNCNPWRCVVHLWSSSGYQFAHEQLSISSSERLSIEKCENAVAGT